MPQQKYNYSQKCNFKFEVNNEEDNGEVMMEINKYTPFRYLSNL